jgi:ubiquitin thioesterase ZRANB1
MSERGIKWACKYCTYKNWPSAIKCTMCGAQKPTGIIAEDPFKSDSSDVGRDWILPALNFVMDFVMSRL